MPEITGFAFRSGVLSRHTVLHCDAVPVSRLAEKYGTPLYVYSGSTIRARFEAFDAAFSVPHSVCYSVKANSNLTILKMLASMGAGFDVVSGGELQRVLHADKRVASRVVFSGVGKTVEEIDFALRAGIMLFNVESESELWTLAARAKKLKKVAPVALRVNPDVPASTHPYISTGLHKHKFGVPIDFARTLYRRADSEEWLDVAGVSAHIGSQIVDVAPFKIAVERLVDLARTLRQDGMNVRYLDAGGGLGIRYEHANAKTITPSTSEFARRARTYADAVTAPLRGTDLHLLLEPGRAIVGPSGALITRVLYVKTNGDKRFAVVDGAMNDLIRPSLYGAHHDIVPIERRSGKAVPYDVVGPICETGDFFARDRAITPVREGEFVAILDSGAYGMALSSNYNTRMRAAEVLITGSKVRQIRKRDRFEDVIRNEV